MELNKFATEVHQNAVEHGWWEEERTFGEIIALCHSELSEALEEFRAGRPMVWQHCTAADGKPCISEGCGDWEDGICELNALGEKPEGIAVEMADCIIRILDYMGKKKADVDRLVAEAETLDDMSDANNVGDLIADLHLTLSIAYLRGKEGGNGCYFSLILMAACIVEIRHWAEKNGVDMDEILRLKHEYNKGRPYRHGGKVL